MSIRTNPCLRALRWLGTAGCACLLLALAAGPRAIAAGPPAAGDALYDVEMVVFRAVSVGSAEDWSIRPTGRGFGAPPAGTPPPAPQVLRVLPARDYRLDGVISDLRRSGRWRPIAHAAWVQTATAWGSHVGVPLSQLGVSVPGLSGTAYLERARLYLHLGFDVSLASGAATYTIDEMRNVRANEKQYYDHPAIGIIAVVRPVKRPPGG